MHNEKYFDRDLSWLSFNKRVLMEAGDNSVPLFERLKFLAIYSSNLDEFYRVRVAAIRSLAKIKKKKIRKKLNTPPIELLTKINDEVSIQLDQYGKLLREELIPGLEKEGLKIYSRGDKLNGEQKHKIFHYFKTHALSFLKPVWLSGENNYFLNNGELYLAVKLKNRKTNLTEYAYVNIPSDKIPRFLKVSFENQQHLFIFLDDILKMNLSFVFPEHRVLGSYSIKLNKDADLQIEDEYSGNLVKKINKQIARRNLGTPSRFLFDQSIPKNFLNILTRSFGLDKEDLVAGGPYHNLNDFFQLPNPFGPELENEKLPSLPHKVFDRSKSLFVTLQKSDQILHFPYQSYDYVLQFFNEAAIDPEVKSICVTFYRLAQDSYIGDALISAAKNGKSVTVFMEVKARFDEENNIRWSKRLKDAGVKLIYSIPGIKVHAKVALVIKKPKNGQKIRYGFFGTGNLNEKTAKIYGDHGLFTMDKVMTKELNQLFRYLSSDKTPSPFQELLISQFNILDQLNSLIQSEIENSRKKLAARITIKVNNLEDPEIIDKLYEASNAGVKINLIVRGICCLIPGKKGLSENIKVRRIVDRYLEHARIFIFHNNGKDKVYLGSADLMERNLRRRIEVVFPVKDERIKKQIRKIVAFQMSDNTKATILGQNLENQEVRKVKNAKLRRAQLDTYRYLS